MLTNFKRVLNFALIDFYRNKGMSLAAIFVLTIITLLITGLFLIHGVSDYLISTVQNKIDITAYFKADTGEQDILNVKDQILKDSPSIKSVQYVSKDDALNNFNERHKDNSVFSEALSEVGNNPFLPSLNITTSGDPSQYEQISNILQSDQFKNLVDKVDFSQKRDIIEKVYSITSNINKFGLGLGAVMVLVAILIIFNTMKLVIKSAEEEISTMRIVGASSWFIKAPFIIEGGIFGFISFVICFFITLFSVYFLSHMVGVIMPGFSLFSYFISNFWIIILIQLGFGAGLGALSSLIALGRLFNNNSTAN